MPPQRWLIFNFENHNIMETLFKTDIYLRSEVTTIGRFRNESIFRIFQHYKISPNKPGVINENYGYWNPNEPNQIVDNRTSSIISRRRSNLQKSILRATHVSIFGDNRTDWKSNK